MHNLTALKEFFIKNSIKIDSFNGMFLVTRHGKWGMAGGEFRLNGIEISRKSIKKLVEEVKI